MGGFCCIMCQTRFFPFFSSCELYEIRMKVFFHFQDSNNVKGHLHQWSDECDSCISHSATVRHFGNLIFLRFSIDLFVCDENKNNNTEISRVHFSIHLLASIFARVKPQTGHTHLHLSTLRQTTSTLIKKDTKFVNRVIMCTRERLCIFLLRETKKTSKLRKKNHQEENNNNIMKVKFCEQKLSALDRIAKVVLIRALNA